MNPRIRSSVLMMCLGLGFVTSAQAVEPGWYVLGFGGEASASGASENLATEKLVAIFESNGVDVIDVTATIDDSDTGFGIAGGYQLNDHFAFEFAYVDLGSVSYQLSATVSDGTNEADADVQLESSADGPVVSALGILPIGERFSVFGRVGLSLMNAKGTARITIDGVTQSPSQSTQNSDPMFRNRRGVQPGQALRASPGLGSLYGRGHGRRHGRHRRRPLHPGSSHGRRLVPLGRSSAERGHARRAHGRGDHRTRSAVRGRCGLRDGLLGGPRGRSHRIGGSRVRRRRHVSR